jgi:hypothetical protein
MQARHTKGFNTTLFVMFLGACAPLLPSLAATNSEIVANEPKISDAVPEGSYQYTSFYNKQYSLIPWVGKHVALLTKNHDLDRNAVARMLKTIDDAYEHYQFLTGKSPQSWRCI